MASEYRLRRGPVVGLLLIIGVVGALLVARSSVRPQVDVYGAVTVPAAYDGTTYAFDSLVCGAGTSRPARCGCTSRTGRSGCCAAARR